MTSTSSAMTWGSPTAMKHALLIHGLTSSSHTWHRVATSLANQGYFVTAPNLVGHGSRVSTDYHVNSIAEDLRPYLAGKHYSLIMGHSLGALTALALSTHISSSQPIAFVLVDPPLQASQETISISHKLSEACANPIQADAYALENPLWTHGDCISRELGTRLCSVEAVHSVFEQNMPWSFLDYLNNVNATSKKWRLTVLISDPAICVICPVEALRPYPHARPVIVSGAGHWMQHDFPDVVVEQALKTVAELEIAQPSFFHSLNFFRFF